MPSYVSVSENYAVIDVGGVQHLVEEGRWYTCNRLNVRHAFARPSSVVACALPKGHCRGHDPKDSSAGIYPTQGIQVGVAHNVLAVVCGLCHAALTLRHWAMGACL